MNNEIQRMLKSFDPVRNGNLKAQEIPVMLMPLWKLCGHKNPEKAVKYLIKHQAEIRNKLLMYHESRT